MRALRAVGPAAAAYALARVSQGPQTGVQRVDRRAHCFLDSTHAPSLTFMQEVLERETLELRLACLSAAPDELLHRLA